jgi:hypothetical protein
MQTVLDWVVRIDYIKEWILIFSPKAIGFPGFHPRPPRLSGSRWRAGGKPGKENPNDPVNPVE